MVSVSEGTPGRGPDADSRTDSGDGQAPTNGRPVVPPVRYGPRNGGPNGANGRGPAARPTSAPSSPQQYRAPQPPRTPANGTPPNGTPANGTPAPGTNGAGTNGNGTNGAHAVTPASYTRPRPNAAPTRPEPTEQERRVADARIAAAARNASAAKVRGGSALSGRTPTAPETRTSGAQAESSLDETAVIPVVPAEPADEAADTTQATPVVADETTPEKARGGRFGRLRNRRPAEVAAPAAAAAAATAAASSTAEASPVTSDQTDAKTDAQPEAKTDGATTEAKSDDATAETAAATEPTADATTATTERPLTWRDRLGITPKEPKQPADAPTEPSGTTADGDATTSATALAVGTTAATVPVQDRVSPSPFAPGGSPDTVVIPPVDASSTGAPAPVAGATALPVVPAAAPKPKVGAARRTRKARLRLSRVDPWSVMKTALLFSIAAGIILVVATYGVWSVLNASGLFDAVNDMVKSVVSTPGDTTPFRIEEYVNTQKIIGVAALIAVVDVLIFTALATLGSFLYNLAATVLGGLEVTLAED